MSGPRPIRIDEYGPLPTETPLPSEMPWLGIMEEGTERGGPVGEVGVLLPPAEPKGLTKSAEEEWEKLNA